MSRSLTLGVWTAGILMLLATIAIIEFYPQESQAFSGLLSLTYLVGSAVTLSGFVLEGIRFSESKENAKRHCSDSTAALRPLLIAAHRRRAREDAPTSRLARRSTDAPRDWVVGTHKHKWSK